jgi:valyl-tRNA synthetase
MFTTTLIEANLDTITALKLQEAHRNELAELQHTIQQKESTIGILHYQLAFLSSRSILEVLANYIKDEHSRDGGKCRWTAKNKETTTGCLEHLMACQLLADDLQKSINLMSDFKPNFTERIAAELFSHLSAKIHTEMYVEEDCVYIPASLSKVHRHILVAIAAWRCIEFKYINLLGQDVTDSVEPRIRAAYNIISPSHSKSNSTESLTEEAIAAIGSFSD